MQLFYCVSVSGSWRVFLASTVSLTTSPASHRRSLQILKGFFDLYGLVSFNNVSCLDVIEVFNVEAALIA
jgi:hypothetical protein